MTTTQDALWGLPDPETQPEFYDHVAMKRAFAWMIDAGLIFALTLLIALLTCGIGFFVFVPLWLVMDFLYRMISVSNRSATPGMRLMAIELRTGRGERFDVPTAFFHVTGYYITMMTVILQVLSIAMLFSTARRQGLTDMFLGTSAINRFAKS